MAPFDTGGDLSGTRGELGGLETSPSGERAIELSDARVGALLVAALAILATSAGYGQGTPDGETPANEGVCDDLVGFTPGLYGLCVAFCEAQDCEAVVNSATGEVTFHPGCKPSSPKLLRTYNKRKTPDDPPMPCVKDPCPCWTQEELDLIADGVTDGCQPFPPLPWALFGFDAADPGFHEDALTGPAGLVGPRPVCFYRSSTLVRFQLIEAIELDACNISLAAECDSRGF